MRTRTWKSIVVAIGDPSAAAQVGLKKAQALALSCNARLTLLHVFAMPYPVSQGVHSTKELLAATSSRLKLQLERLAKPLQASGLRVSCIVEWDFPIQDGIVRHVLEAQPDLLIAESHHHNPFARWLLNNTDWELIRACPCPLWFVKKPRFSKLPSILAAVDPFHAFAKPADLDGQIVQVANNVAKLLQGRMTLAHACDTTTAIAVAVPFEAAVVTSSPERTRELVGDAKRALRKLADQAQVKPFAQIVEAGVPSNLIQQLAKKANADVVVMGAVSRRGLQRIFIGNTAERIIDPIRCDVLIIKPKGFKTSVSRHKPKLPK